MNKFAIASIIAASAGAAFAGSTVFVDLAGANFNGPDGSPANEVIVAPLGAPGDVVNAIGWDLTIEAFDTSWLSEATFGIDWEGDGVYDIRLIPGIDDDGPGTGTYSTGGLIFLGDAGIPDGVLTSGSVTITLFDTFDDLFEPQATILQGGLSFNVIPAPGAAALLGLGGLVATRRRR